MAIPEERGDKQEHKGADRAGALVLPVTAAMQPLMGKPRKRGFVFSTAGGSEAFSGFSKAKRVGQPVRHPADAQRNLFEKMPIDRLLANLQAADEKCEDANQLKLRIG